MKQFTAKELRAIEAKARDIYANLTPCTYRELIWQLAEVAEKLAAPVEQNMPPCQQRDLIGMLGTTAGQLAEIEETPDSYYRKT